MVSEAQLRELTGMVRDALSHERNRRPGENEALGRAIQYVDDLLLSWARSRAGDEIDVENIVADAGLKMLRGFADFRGLTGREFFGYMKATVQRDIAHALKLREALDNGRVRRTESLERHAEAARLAERLASREQSPEMAAIIRENAQRLRRVMRGLTVEQLRVVRLHGVDGYSLREISARLGHAPSWAQEVWEAAATEIRTRLMRPCRGKRRPRAAPAA